MTLASPPGNPLLLDTNIPTPRMIGVIGAGTIGPDIAYYLKSALPRLSLVLVDIEQEALDNAGKRIHAYVAKGLARGKLSAPRAASVTENLLFTTDYQKLSRCDWVLEAATENLDLKHRIFAQVEEIVAEQAIITSNTSSLPASRLFSGLKHPERATVTHFFAPAFRNPAVEVVRWPAVDQQVVNHLCRLFCSTGKVPLLTSDAICFMLDRVFDNWCNEAAHLLEVASAAQVDTVASRFVHAGPFFVLNMARGNPIIVETNTLQMEEGQHYRPAPIFRSVDTWATCRPGGAVPLEPAIENAVRDRLLGILFSQSYDILDRGIGAQCDLDLGCCLALGFKKGPLQLMQELGEDQVERINNRFLHERPGMPAPERGIPGYLDFLRHLLIDDLDGVKVITIRRPQAMNALDDSVTDEILSVLLEYEGDPALQGFVITGYGPRAFCAGADIGRFPEMLGDSARSADYARDCSRLLLHLDQMNKPVVAALNGLALGGGLELAMRCHAILATPEAVLQFPEVTLGIAPGLGGMVVPYRKWPGAASILDEMLCQAASLEARQAHEVGIVETLVNGQRQLIIESVGRVHQLVGNVQGVPQDPVELEPSLLEPRGPRGEVLSAQVLGIIQSAIREAARAETLNQALELGYRAFGATACTPAAREGIRAFLDRRAPDFSRTG